METRFTENLCQADRIIRAIVGFALAVGSSMIFALSPAMMAALCLLAVYPLMTALIGWDPLVAGATGMFKKLGTSALHTLPASRVARA